MVRPLGQVHWAATALRLFQPFQPGQEEWVTMADPEGNYHPAGC